MIRKIRNCIMYAALVGILASCSSSRKIAYLQDIQPNVSMMVQTPQLIRFEPGDQIKIIVHSRDTEIGRVFNLLDNSGSGRGNHTFYIIDENGYVDMPILGKIKLQGLTREEAINEIKYRLLESRLVKDPVVTLTYDGMGFSVLGEVSSPGRKPITRDCVTILEGIAESGDLTIDGKRDNILVLRTENGKQVPYRVNLLDTESVYSSPVYYLQQNDVVYVEPNEKKSNTSTANGNLFLTPGFWMSTASFLTSFILLLTRL